MRVVTPTDRKLINDLYYKLHTYAAVARETGFSPATVKKYVIDGYKPEEEREIKRFDQQLPPFDDTLFLGNDWGPLCELSEIEVGEIIDLWEELDA